MRDLPSGLSASLASGVTTLCWCWRLIRQDGAVLGFTDHDRPLVFDGTTFEAASGFTASEMSSSIGLSVDNLEVDGALSSDTLSEADLAGGLFDDAKIEVFVVDWQNVEDRALLRVGSVGEVKRKDSLFTAEVRGLAHYLQQPTGRLYQAQCDADLGDARCRVKVDQPAFSGTATVTAVVTDRSFVADGLDEFEDGWFALGFARFATGAATGQEMEIKSHTKMSVGDVIELWQPVRGPIVVGQNVNVTAGCDKRYATCRDKFQNVINFQGFPFIPGNDRIAKIA